MPRIPLSYLLSIGLLAGLGAALLAADPPKDAKPEDKPALPDLSEYRTVENAITTRISKAAPTQQAQPGYLGVHIESDKGKLVVGEVEADSPAANAGLLKGDVIAQAEGKALDHL